MVIKPLPRVGWCDVVQLSDASQHIGHLVRRMEQRRRLQMLCALSINGAAGLVNGSKDGANSVQRRVNRLQCIQMS